MHTDGCSEIYVADLSSYTRQRLLWIEGLFPGNVFYRSLCSHLTKFSFSEKLGHYPLFTLQHRFSDMDGVTVYFVLIVYIAPNNGSSNSWCDPNVQFVKECGASFLDIVQIH